MSSQNKKYRVYYLSICLAVLTFAVAQFYLPSQLNRDVPAETKIYILDGENDILGSLVIKPQRLIRDMQKDATAVTNADKDHIESLHVSKLLLSSNPKLILWLIFHVIGLSLSLALLPLLVSHFLSITESRWRMSVAFFASLISVVLLFILNTQSNEDILFVSGEIMTKTKVIFGEKNHLLNYIVSIYLVSACVGLAINILLGIEYIEGKKGELGEMKKMYWSALRATSVLLTLGIITTSLLQQSIITAIGKGYAALFPDEYVIAYSMHFSFFLLLFFAPVGYLLYKDKEFDEEINPSKKLNLRVIELTIAALAPMLTAIIVELIKQ